MWSAEHQSHILRHAQMTNPTYKGWLWLWSKKKTELPRNKGWSPNYRQFDTTISNLTIKLKTDRYKHPYVYEINGTQNQKDQKEHLRRYDRIIEINFEDTAETKMNIDDMENAIKQANVKIKVCRFKDTFSQTRLHSVPIYLDLPSLDDATRKKYKANPDLHPIKVKLTEQEKPVIDEKPLIHLMTDFPLIEKIDSDIFSEHDLQENDIIEEVNGYKLNEYEDVQTVLSLQLLKKGNNKLKISRPFPQIFIHEYVIKKPTTNLTFGTLKKLNYFEVFVSSVENSILKGTNIKVGTMIHRVVRVRAKATS
jgi:hypothetical protein